MAPPLSRPNATPQPGFSLRGTCFHIDRRPVLGPLSLDLPMGGITAVIGPNGSGKSTLMNLLSRQQSGDDTLSLDGRPLSRWSDRDFARRVAYLPQFPAMAEGFLLRELVALGRHPWTGSFRPLDDHGRAMVSRALALTGLEALAEREVSTLSGGERQRGWIATLIAQETRILLLDEPTSALDINQQIALLRLVSNLDRTVIAVLHDINLAARFCDRIVALRDGQVMCQGRPEDVMTPEVLLALYDQSMIVTRHPVTGSPHAFPE